MRSWLLMASVPLLLVIPGDSRARRETKLSSAEAGQVLEAVNVQARAAYAAARERAVERVGPIVLLLGDDLVLRYGSVRLTRRITPALYHDLKVVGHIVLSLDAILLTTEETIGERRAFELKQHRELIEKTRNAIRQRGLTKPQEERQEKILLATDAYIQTLLRERKADRDGRIAFLRKLRPLLDENGVDAARGQLDGLHREMLGFKDKLSEEAWKRMRVIVQGSQQPRKDNLAVQYFGKLLGESGEGPRIIYAESLYEEPKALALLGTKLLDVGVGTDIWDEPGHLYRDLLADAAKAYLEELFKKKE